MVQVGIVLKMQHCFEHGIKATDPRLSPIHPEAQKSARYHWDLNCALVPQDVSRQFESLLRDYQQVRDDVAQGLGFYSQLQEAVKTLHKEIGDYSLAR